MGGGRRTTAAGAREGVRLPCPMFGNVYKSRVIGKFKKLFGGTQPRVPSSFDGPTLEIVRLEAQSEVLSLKEFLGEECFAGLRTLDRKIPSPGEIILSEAGGLRLETIAANLKQFVVRLDEEIGAAVEATQSDRAKTLLQYVARFDDLADVGSRRIEDPEMLALVENLLEYNLALINDLQQQLDSETIERLIKRFAAREGLRGVNLRPFVEVPALHLS